MPPELPAEPVESPPMSCVDAMIGATLALMTGHAQCDCPSRQQHMALKVRSHLKFLSCHPDLSPGLRQLASQVDVHWASLCHGAPERDTVQLH